MLLIPILLRWKFLIFSVFEGHFFLSSISPVLFLCYMWVQIATSVEPFHFSDTFSCHCSLFCCVLSSCCCYFAEIVSRLTLTRARCTTVGSGSVLWLWPEIINDVEVIQHHVESCGVLQAAASYPDQDFSTSTFYELQWLQCQRFCKLPLKDMMYSLTVLDQG